MTGSFLHEPPVSPRVQALYDDDLAGDGYIWSLSRLWAHQPETLGAQPDAQLARSVPQEVREAVTYGRPVAT
jgi:hypothetical protein